MNSEELEVSLRTEFETYLKNVLAEKQEEISRLQEQVSTEIERHKSELDQIFASAVGNFANQHSVAANFKDSVVEHLRLARDEGAQITAMAIARAEEMEKDTVSSVGVKEIYEAVNDISTKPSQSEILKSLVHHATNFAPRGAFFIVKNEHLVGWRVFGKEKGAAEEKVREVFIPVSADSVLSESVKTLDTVANGTGGFHADAEVLRKLEFGEPLKMVAIPLVARGRGVAVLYADYGNEGGEVNVEALETLVRVAGLTVEVLASGKSAAPIAKKSTDKAAEDVRPVSDVSLSETGGLSSEVLANHQSFATPATTTVVEPAYDSFTTATAVVEQKVAEPAETTDFTAPSKAKFDDYPTESEVADNPTTEFSTNDSDFQSTAPAMEFQDFSKPSEAQFETVETSTFETSSWSSPVEEKVETDYTTENYSSFENSTWSSTTETVPGVSAQEFAQNFAKETDPAEYAKDFSNQAEEFQTQAPVEEFVPTKEQTFEIENGTSSATAAPKPRLSERNVDLPIEVGEDERRLHNDARRFARLLVSEIKLYNEQKVKEGRDSGDLYDRLKEAIDRSREMYDKRVQPPVAAKFDYFHYELVNTLAEGDDNKLGADYPGAMV